MSKQIATMLGDAEYNHMQKALLKSGESTYEFVKEAVLRHADLILSTDRNPMTDRLIEALRSRKWALHQMEDYSDRNHAAWLKTRFPEAMEREIADALTLFRTKVSNIQGREIR